MLYEGLSINPAANAAFGHDSYVHFVRQKRRKPRSGAVVAALYPRIGLAVGDWEAGSATNGEAGIGRGEAECRVRIESGRWLEAAAECLALCTCERDEETSRICKQFYSPGRGPAGGMHVMRGDRRDLPYRD